ncbi:RES domain-containing protein [Enterobacter hormaechei subsp. steigerwaltii]|nr:RES domain-containing protein [Enterobacter hormaechei subsp. steigerwaltii]MCU2829581.1 RES domain-containing protein [Enterobacter hormaechei subsp. steigerwaltii]MCU2911521.1 RES domain-containing protein [Enterobacter hormaechei subsp. steigerwaltii]MCU3646843.1 RES domain-containing protein [Enterobacter hormaechei subsp. steigerwaltii]MCU3666321.1 RES domain-containing protein [Enterobacter hormaechei subsp. steigerwaltii]
MNQFTEDLHNVVAQILAGAEISDSEIFKELTIEPDFYKVQDQYYGGNGIYFNSESETRFSLRSKSKGVLYLATTAFTGLKEFYQDAPLVETEDLEKNCMAVIQAARTIKIIDLAALAPHLKTPLGYLMGSKAVYEDTQWLAEVLSHYGVLGIFRPKTTKCSGGPAVCGLQRGITFFEIPIWALFE